MKERLFKRNANGDIIEWNISSLGNGDIEINFGAYGRDLRKETIKAVLKKVNEVDSRINAKRKEGYKSIEDMYDNSPTRITASATPRRENGDIEEQYLYSYLQTYLPKYNSTKEGFVLPMLAKTLEDNKPFDKYGVFLGQIKINGLRCLIGAKKSNDLFNTVSFTYTSREGTSWDLSWMDDILLKSISYELLDRMIFEGVYLDGELYLPGYTVNDINSFVKNKELPQHYKLQYWCYDIAIENESAGSRQLYLDSNLHINRLKDITKDIHLNNVEPLIRVTNFIIDNIQVATEFRDKYIYAGFEGLIIRNPNAEYAFGKRNSAMFKYKKKEDGLFDIIDIKEDKRGLPIYVLKNDINDELFECTLNATHDAQKFQLSIKNDIIGKKGVVEFRERSGVKQVPFHAKLIKIYL